MRILLLCILIAFFTSGQAFITPSHKTSIKKTLIQQDDPFSCSIRIDSSNRTPSTSIIGKKSSSTSKTSLNAIPIGALNTFYINFPYLSAFVTCGIKASLADVIAQKRQKKKANNKKSKLQLKAQGTASPDDLTLNKNVVLTEGDDSKYLKYQRNMAFILYGGFYQGIAQEYIFNHLFPIWFGSGTGMRNVLTKVVFDMLVLSPLLCLPIAYLFKALVFKYSLKEGLRRYKDDIFQHGLLKKYWSLWFPVQCLTFGVVPAHLRIAFIASVSFFWLIILSSISTKERTKSSDGDIEERDFDEELEKLKKQSKDMDLSVDGDYDYDDSCLLIDGLTCDDSD